MRSSQCVTTYLVHEAVEGLSLAAGRRDGARSMLRQSSVAQLLGDCCHMSDGRLGADVLFFRGCIVETDFRFKIGSACSALGS